VYGNSTSVRRAEPGIIASAQMEPCSLCKARTKGAPICLECEMKFPGGAAKVPTEDNSRVKKADAASSGK